MKRKIEKSLSSPSLTESLIPKSEDPPEKKVKKESEVGSILRKGIKFSGPEEYQRFMEPTSEKKRKKRKENKKVKKKRDKNGDTGENSSKIVDLREKLDKIKEVKVAIVPGIVSG